MNQKYVTTPDGTKIFYYTVGSGKPLVFFHGNGLNSHYFDKQVPFFKDMYSLVLIDSRGQGDSGNESSFLTVDMMADDVVSVLNQENISSASIIGFSDGANIAMKFTLKYPSLVDCLVLNSGSLNLYGIRLIFKIGAWLLYVICKFISKVNTKFISKFNLTKLMIQDTGVLVTDLKKIKKPTLVLVGENDIIKCNHSRMIASGISSSKFKVITDRKFLFLIPGLGHFIAKRKSVEFNECVLAFLKNNRY